MILVQECPMQYLGHTYTKKSVVYLKLKFSVLYFCLLNLATQLHYRWRMKHTAPPREASCEKAGPE